MEISQQLHGLPPRLIRFFERYPPQLYSAKYTGVSLPLTRRDSKLLRIAEADQRRQEVELQAQEAENAASAPFVPPVNKIQQAESPIPTASITDANQTPDDIVPGPRHPFPPNPFLPFRNPTTGRWAGARFGLRHQADLVKIAKLHNLEALLPPGRKSSAFKEERTLQRGLRIKGTGEGQQVKGHIWERTMPKILEGRRKALEEMPKLVREWERRGHGRGWKEYPRAKTK